ncbi:hypothetical protein FA15DRAFT_655659 [Coprinopsis marcescibilis]|uniref:Uncharacterized protein n=1 Tax=Coprinopsis marcescibilis TaxID=230819 RepID=A0A5C3KX04_COPMA|nr:hypothetical protein FA15DRAFT_655659 [Coprinopsis marcescibilis]
MQNRGSHYSPLPASIHSGALTQKSSNDSSEQLQGCSGSHYGLHLSVPSRTAEKSVGSQAVRNGIFVTNVSFEYRRPPLEKGMIELLKKLVFFSGNARLTVVRRKNLDKDGLKASEGHARESGTRQYLQPAAHGNLVEMERHRSIQTASSTSRKLPQVHQEAALGRIRDIICLAAGCAEAAEAQSEVGCGTALIGKLGPPVAGLTHTISNHHHHRIPSPKGIYINTQKDIYAFQKVNYLFQNEHLFQAFSDAKSLKKMYRLEG